MSSKVTINGTTYSGNNISVHKNVVMVDGIIVTPNDKIVNISVNGDIGLIVADVCEKVTITGNVSEVKTQTGDIDITGNVNGPVKTQTGDIDIGGTVTGDVHTQVGDIKYRK
jgi:hypothetical protein